jgi:hypothetical protein
LTGAAVLKFKISACSADNDIDDEIFWRTIMLTLMLNLVGVIGLTLFVSMLYQAFLRQPKNNSDDKPVSMEYYVFKIARITGNSEYDVFCKSAENWPVSKARIDQDFKRYLCDQEVPHYVNDFVRKNKKHIDELHIPRF